MPREDWKDREDERLRRSSDRDRDNEDFGQADYSNAYGYDPRTRTGYRSFDEGRGVEPERREQVERHYRDYGAERRESRRRGPSDRVLWAIIMERLDDERGLDLRHVDVEVRDGEVILSGTVRHKADKRRIEDIADVEGVRNVQNNLRPRESDRRWTFF